ncbi:hypothetical protein TVAG_168190 [Trichomonas vaginalis G3]|uniref:Uncharacterized protein n=1 Tax=Trichomonas vaginalis (strain ATCC PRA-98 / G3) TaxID=412133 RepID=A2FBI7_TRIV3|nr:hypothetical protein TVAGG3_0129710 [Trichomonas vaginalis G3]EAX97722.1 hypothetical protein TVAG_168190 [Trichomonas vaginalis G3]KAI5546015.1 hypothetical protein TVAGG3_0129710 [Trichomonas vaginalis G3]|eukprot:XP_001310652.1 hypothetical protein [Trichomonas vaginalis G3]
MSNHQAAIDIAISYYRSLAPFKNEIYIIEDVLLLNNRQGAVIFIATINILYFLFTKLRLPTYSIIALFSIIYLARFYIYKGIRNLSKMFQSRDYEEADDIITIHQISIFAGVGYIFFGKLINYFEESVLNFNLVTVAYVMFALYSLFIITYYLGDTIFLWVLLHCLFLVPIMLYYRIDFKLFQFPFSVEREISIAILKYVEQKEKEEKEQQELKEKEQKEQEQKEKEQKEREQKEKEEREQKEKEQKEQEQREKEQKEKELKENEQKEQEHIEQNTEHKEQTIDQKEQNEHGHEPKIQTQSNEPNTQHVQEEIKGQHPESSHLHSETK